MKAPAMQSSKLDKAAVSNVTPMPSNENYGDGPPRWQGDTTPAPAAKGHRATAAGKTPDVSASFGSSTGIATKKVPPFDSKQTNDDPPNKNLSGDLEPSDDPQNTPSAVGKSKLGTLSATSRPVEKTTQKEMDLSYKEATVAVGASTNPNSMFEERLRKKVSGSLESEDGHQSTIYSGAGKSKLGALLATKSPKEHFARNEVATSYQEESILAEGAPADRIGTSNDRLKKGLFGGLQARDCLKDAPTAVGKSKPGAFSVTDHPNKDATKQKMTLFIDEATTEVGVSTTSTLIEPFNDRLKKKLTGDLGAGDGGQAAPLAVGKTSASNSDRLVHSSQSLKKYQYNKNETLECFEDRVTRKLSTEVSFQQASGASSQLSKSNSRQDSFGNTATAVTERQRLSEFEARVLRTQQQPTGKDDVAPGSQETQAQGGGQMYNRNEKRGSLEDRVARKLADEAPFPQASDSPSKLSKSNDRRDSFHNTCNTLTEKHKLSKFEARILHTQLRPTRNDDNVFQARAQCGGQIQDTLNVSTQPSSKSKFEDLVARKMAAVADSKCAESMKGGNEEDQPTFSENSDVELGIKMSGLNQQPEMETNHIHQHSLRPPAAEAQNIKAEEPAEVMVEAYLVEEKSDDEQPVEYVAPIYDAVAIAVEPWWRQKRKLICVVLVILLLCGMGATIVALVGRSSNVNGIDEAITSGETIAEQEPSSSPRPESPFEDGDMLQPSLSEPAPILTSGCSSPCPDGGLPCKYEGGGTDWDWRGDCNVAEGYVNLLRERDSENPAVFDRASEEACRDAMKDLVRTGVDIRFEDGDSFSSYATDRPAGCHIACEGGLLVGRFNPNAWNYIGNTGAGSSEPLCVREPETPAPIPTSECPSICPDGGLPCKYDGGGTDWDWKGDCNVAEGYINLLRERDSESPAVFDRASEEACRDAMKDLVRTGVDIHFEDGDSFSSYTTDRPAGCHIACEGGLLVGRFNPNAWNYISNTGAGSSEPLCVREPETPSPIPTSECPSICPDGGLPCKYEGGGTDWDWRGDCNVGEGYTNLLRGRDSENPAVFDRASEEACRDAMKDLARTGVDIHFEDGDSFSSYATDRPAGCHTACEGGLLVGRFNPNAWNYISNTGDGSSEPLCVREPSQTDRGIL